MGRDLFINKLTPTVHLCLNQEPPIANNAQSMVVAVSSHSSIMVRCTKNVPVLQTCLEGRGVRSV